MKAYEDVTKLVGNTPLVKINKLTEGLYAEIYAKLEFFNPLNSIKDRVAVAIIEDAENKGLIDRDTVIIEATSGNMGIGLAFVCAYKGYKFLALMPETASKERIKIMKFLGAEVILTPGEEGTKGAFERAKKMIKSYKKTFMPSQFTNPVNPGIHRETTGREIWNDMDGKLDIFVAGVGTGGTITGVGEFLKSKNENIKVIAVEPEKAPLLSKGRFSPHKIQGIASGMIPEVLNREIIDEIILVKEEDAFETSRRLAREEGIFAGISSGANMCAALEVAKREENKNKKIVTIFPDTAERYLSTELFEGF
jgi:cysteine synthase A